MRLRISTIVLFLVAFVFTCAVEVSAAEPAPPVPARPGSSTNEVAEAERGRTEARRDLTNGVAIVKFTGLPAPESSTYWRLLSKRCGVSVQPIAGCLVSPELEAYRKSYNEVSTAWVKQKFGTNIFETVWEEAQKLYREEMMAEHEASLKKRANKPSGAELKRVYRVRAGDTFVKIAKENGVPLRELTNANPGVDPKKLQVNQLLALPK